MARKNTFRGTDNQSSAQTAKALVAAVTGESHFITRVTISNGATAGSLRLVRNTASAANLTPEIYLPINGTVVLEFGRDEVAPLRVAKGQDIGYTSTTVTTHSVIVEGYSVPVGG